MAEVNLLDYYSRSKHPIEECSRRITEDHRQIAREFGREFFDGDRLYGYGGYNYHPRFWQDTVQRFRDYCSLSDDDNILDIGCAKGFMLYDFKELMPGLTVVVIDVSE